MTSESVMTDSDRYRLTVRRPYRIISILAVFCLQALLCACTQDAEAPPPEYVSDVSGYSGKLLVSLFSNLGTAEKSSTHYTVLMNNQDHYVMEENDIRGFLDGNFKWGWNQPGQIHVRVGRRGTSAKYGEYELFRNIYRWIPLPLSQYSQVLDSSLKIHVEEPSAYPLSVYLYPVHKDWKPGFGGTRNDNVSPPKEGEVWWREVAHKKQNWGLPGVNFASDNHPSSDTSEMPLAEALYQPGNQFLEFSSMRLTDYINRQLDTHSPLLFLLKLSDHHEDIPGTVLTLYSGNTGDDRNTVKRPALAVEWRASGLVEEREYPVHLEYGRDYHFPKIPISPSQGPLFIAASFKDSSNPLPPTVEFRSGEPGHTSEWTEITHPASIDAEWVQFRIKAVYEPVMLGEAFTAGLKDTWILSAAPEKQHVPWHFTSPSGKKHEVTATYEGDYRWSISFTPDEIGRWNYAWESNFSHAFKSETGTFDVIIGNRENAWEQLKAFKKRIAESPEPEPNELELYMHQFAKLERSALRFLDPDTYDSEDGLKIRGMLNDIRGLIAEKPPEELPLKPNRPLKWQKNKSR